MATNDLLVEIGTEELPPKSLGRLMTSLADALTAELARAQLTHGEVKAYASPRRLAVLVRELAEKQPEQQIERRGPSIQAAFDANGQPTKAAVGFARSCGVADPTTLDTMESEKGAWLVYREEKPGATVQALAETIVGNAVSSLPIERPMRWGTHRAEFVRPVHWVVLLYGADVLPATVLGIGSGRSSRGHRFMSPGEVDLAVPNDYTKALKEANVIVDFDERRETIRAQLNTIADEEKATVVIDDGLLDEVTALVEWPVALCGRFDRGFLDVPEEALISAMTSHQRYFHMTDAAGNLLPRFIAVANLASRDPGAVIAGNERVIAPRLADAAFFYQQDCKSTLEEKLVRLRSVVFQSKLGNYHDKATRIRSLAGFIAGKTGADAGAAERAGLLCKADLVSDMVGEFPELQGIMGGYYARNDGESEAIAMAIADHYLPVQSGGDLPRSAVGRCVALADKLDTLSGLFGIGQPPTGSRDPFALRRQALGVLRICMEAELPLDIVELVDVAASLHGKGFETQALLQYFFDRLAGLYQEHGIGNDTFNAVRNARVQTTVLTELDRRIRAVQAFRDHERAEALVAANKRVANILKQTALDDLPAVAPGLFREDAERKLYDALGKASEALASTDDFEARLLALADLQPVIDTYFDDVLVMAEDEALRQNRMATLASMRKLFLSVADVSMLQL